MNWSAGWIRPERAMGDVVPVFLKKIQFHKKVHAAHLFVTAMGIYEAKINGQRVSRYVLAPGWTSYEHRLQYQEYDVALIPQEGEEICEHEILDAVRIITTPKGERVVDFGQEITGYVEVTVDAEAGEAVHISHGEVLDKHGNFYRANYRKAKADYVYICKDGRQTYHPRLTFYGFRYIRIEEFPGGILNAKPENFKAIAVYSDIRRTGDVSCSNPLLNQLFSNIIWGQKGNFLDIPTDCPQRDERLGWLGDAQVFVRAAALNFDVEKFFEKWLADVRAEQKEDGMVPHVVPDIWKDDIMSSGWGDAVTICPWELYKAYGNPKILKDMFACMKKYVDYITLHAEVEDLWIGGFHFGDWLGLDAPSGSYKGSSREEVIASAYYAYSVSLLVKAGKVLGIDVSEYEKLYQRIVKKFRDTYPVYHTQTEYALAIHFRLAKDCQRASDELAELVWRDGMKLQTGFLGTPYLLYALSDFGHADAAYSLLLRTEFPSWLYPVTKGATTVWEHWDGIMENGDFWSADMNSFNHYAYGAVIDWVYTVAAGIRQADDSAGYQKVCIAPVCDERLDWLSASLETRHGRISSKWMKEGDFWRCEISTPVEAEIIIDGEVHRVSAGKYIFLGKR